MLTVLSGLSLFLKLEVRVDHGRVGMPRRAKQARAVAAAVATGSSTSGVGGDVGSGGGGAPRAVLGVEGDYCGGGVGGSVVRNVVMGLEGTAMVAWFTKWCYDDRLGWMAMETVKAELRSHRSVPVGGGGGGGDGLTQEQLFVLEKLGQELSRSDAKRVFERALEAFGGTIIVRPYDCRHTLCGRSYRSIGSDSR